MKQSRTSSRPWSGWNRYAYLALLICVSVTGTLSAADSDRKKIHVHAWNQCLDSATVVPAARFAPYAYRSVSVAHPEVYLQADDLVSITLEDMPGSRLAYRSRDVRDVELYLRLARRETKGGSFSWGMFTITPDSIYDTRGPRSALEWMELRAPSAAILLRSESSRLSTFESSLLRYTQIIRTGNIKDNLFVVVDKNGVGYLAADTLLWIAGLPNRPVKNWRSVAPALVFDSRSAFSALTGRDDRATDSTLARVMTRLGMPAKLSFGKDDKQRVSRIAATTALTDSSAFTLAVLVASGMVDCSQPSVEMAWQRYVDTKPGPGECARLILDQTLFWANRLSPLAAELASLITPTQLSASLPAVQERYLSWTGRRINKTDTADTSMEAWGCIWSYDLLQTTIDDNRRTRAGSSASHALAMSAALDLAGITHFQLGVKLGDLFVPDQQWLFAENGRHQFNFGIWRSLPDSNKQGARLATLLSTGYTLRGQTTLVSQDGLSSPLDAITIGEDLSRISRQVAHANVTLTTSSGEIIPLQRFLQSLNDGVYSPSACPWPDHAPQ